MLNILVISQLFCPSFSIITISKQSTQAIGMHQHFPHKIVNVIHSCIHVRGNLGFYTKMISMRVVIKLTLNQHILKEIFSLKNDFQFKTHKIFFQTKHLQIR